MSESIEQLEDYALYKDTRPKTLFSRVGIVGAGSVGQNIARMVSSKGLEVVFLDLSQHRVDQAFEELAKELDRIIERWGMTNYEKMAILSSIKGTTDYNKFKGCDIVIEE
jgi:3-hydroxybutyryl-CoA dehydrogenase